jgi:hypothetical protein
MNASIYILFVAIFIVLSGIVAYKFIKPSIHPLLFGWIWFNIWIAIYETYIVVNRDTIKKYGANCENKDFWESNTKDNFWLRAWAEYACFADRRYFDPNNIVFWIELGNAIIVVILLLVYLLGYGNTNILIYVLIIQAYHCFIYFLTWMWENQKVNSIEGYRKYIYLLISAVWIIVPIIIVFIYKTNTCQGPCLAHCYK